MIFFLLFDTAYQFIKGPSLALKWVQISKGICSYVRQLNSRLNSSATQQASTCTDNTESDKRKETQTESTDLYQNFRGKTTICERTTGYVNEIADTD